MSREVGAISTEFNGTTFRSRTEARWAVFFCHLGLIYEYEGKCFVLSDGQRYLPDFYLPEFDAWFEVKAKNDAIVTEEAGKARKLSADYPGQRVWLAIGPPPRDMSANILTLEQWEPDVPIVEILATPENRYRFLEDRRDEDVYWLQADFVDNSGFFKDALMVGGPGCRTDHDRLPLLHRRVLAAYKAAQAPSTRLSSSVG